MKKLIGFLGLLFLSFNIQAQEYVDLGLSVNWATYNVGAKSIEQLGTIFVMGQIVEWQDHKDFYKQNKHLAVVHAEDYSGNPQYDAATENWDHLWRTPRRAEWQELMDRCTWRWVQYQNETGVLVKGYEVTGPNGNMIFLPEGGYQCSTPIVEAAKMNVVYLVKKKRVIHWHRYVVGADWIFGFPVRAVRDK